MEHFPRFIIFTSGWSFVGRESVKGTCLTATDVASNQFLLLSRYLVQRRQICLRIYSLVRTFYIFFFFSSGGQSESISRENEAGIYRATPFYEKR